MSLYNVSGGSTIIAFAGASATTATTGLTAGTTAATTVAGFGGVDISTKSGADAAIASMDSALSALNAGRADLGAYQNRFSSAISNLQTTLKI